MVVDQSQSQGIENRTAETEEIRAQVERGLSGLDGIEVRTVVVDRASGAGADGTRLFDAAYDALSDVPPDRVAGALLITDGQVHDAPEEGADSGIAGPVHALITGRPDEIDRRIVLDRVPRFGLVDSIPNVELTVEDQGAGEGSGTARLTVRRDGEEIASRDVPIGRRVSVPVDIAHGGDNIFEFEVGPRDGELSTVNNQAVAIIDGVRDNLRVLLVSGEPHAGERTWRNLLKSDASVDLVHFTILRPPEKQDGTPINELSLIAFPTRELFSEKIDQFDLIVFDRYHRRNVLPSLYFDNIAQYIRNGGAVLVSSGPDYAGLQSIFYTPLADVLPAEPTGQVLEQPFYPHVSALGDKHPVTRDLPGAAGDPPDWSQWFRLIDADPITGDTVMTGPDGKPLAFEILVQSSEQERIALAYKRSLDRVGIQATIRQVDDAQYQARKNAYDYDMILATYSASLSPGAEQVYRWGSVSRDLPGTFNYAGAADPALDTMIGEIVAARSREDFVTAVRAYDRLLISGYYVLPLFHLPEQWLARWKFIQHPETTPLYGYQLPAFWRDPASVE